MKMLKVKLLAGGVVVVVVCLSLLSVVWFIASHLVS